MRKRKVISRRSSLRSLGFMGTAGVLGTSRPAVSSAAQRTYATALAIVGDRYHNPDYIKTSLNKTLVDEAGLSIDYVWEDDLVTEELLSNYKLLIIFRDGDLHPKGYIFAYPSDLPKPGRNGSNIISDPPLPKTGGDTVAWMTPAQGKFIKSFVKNGGSLWAFHNNSQCSNMNQDYRDVEGAIYTGHPRIRPFWVRITNHVHPITRGVKDFRIVDEQHYVTYDKDPKYVLARSYYEGDDPVYTDNAGRKSNNCEAAWAYEYGKGRVCFMAPGHMITVMWNPEYEKMQKNAVKWLLKET